MRIIKELIPYVVIILVVVLIRTFIATPVIVSGSSMDPTLKNGQVLILNKLAKKYMRDDIVVIDAKINGKKERIVKRVIGLPGETLEYKDGFLYINGKRTHDDFVDKTRDFTLERVTGKKKIPENYYFVMGDNRTGSSDSRMFGCIPYEKIEGKVVFRFWPLNKMGVIKTANY